MKLTKSKISKLYNKTRQSFKRYKKIKSSYKKRTFRKRKVNLARKSLKRFNYKIHKGGNPIYKFQYLDKVNWNELSSNPNAIPILEKNLDKVDWWMLSGNPNAIPILEKNLDKVDWRMLSKNPNAIPILENHIDKVNWDSLSQNPNADLLLIKLDYQAMKLNKKDVNRELVEQVFHPERLTRICERNDLKLCDLLDEI